jgi:hypothetical protein
VVSDVFDGDCIAPGVTDGVDEVLDFTYYDHAPILCTLVGP